jgi:hypothetical protein
MEKARPKIARLFFVFGFEDPSLSLAEVYHFYTGILLRIEAESSV